MDKKESILIFGGGILQLSIIGNCNDLGLTTIVIDPDENALGKETADFFYPIGGQDFQGTCDVIDKHEIKGIVTASTDKPLLMMAEIAMKYNFPHYSVETAKLCTDKYEMKLKFVQNGIPCASGKKVYSIDDIETYPTIIKPVDNSGSRGVYYCHSRQDADMLFEDSMQYTKKDYLLAVTVISGREYSIESAHFNGQTKIIQFTEKITTDFPTNVELSHIAPTLLSQEIKDEIEVVVNKIAKAFNFEDCISHTEVKIQDNKVIVIETSPRTGGDYITSHLVPISSDVNIEKLLIQIALGQPVELNAPKEINAGIFYFLLKDGTITKLNDLSKIIEIDGVEKFFFRLKEGDVIPTIKNSLDRYGFTILRSENLEKLEEFKTEIFQLINDNIEIQG